MISRDRKIEIKNDDFKIRAWVDATFIPVDVPNSNKVFRRVNIEFNNKRLVHRLDARDVLKGEEYVDFDGNMKCVVKILDFDRIVWSNPKAERPITDYFFKWLKARITVESETRYRHTSIRMVCPYCERVYSEKDWKYCPYDGHRLIFKE